MKKKITSLLLITILILTLSLGLSACNNGNDTDKSNNKIDIYGQIPQGDGLIIVDHRNGGYYVKDYYGDIINLVIPDIYNNREIWGIFDFAFSCSETLKSVKFGKYIGDINSSIFFGSKNLEKIEVDKNNCSFYVKDNCLISKYRGSLILGIKTSIIPNDITHIEHRAFMGCYGLEQITIPKSVEIIEAEAFSCCINLKDIYYTGTIEEWNKINIDTTCFWNTPTFTIHCTDGDI